MARFDVHELRVQTDVPLVVDVQADLLDDLRTRVVIPLLPLAVAKDEVTARLKPVLHIAGEPHVLMTTDLSAIPCAALGACVASIDQQRQLVTDALDFLFQGF
jgi:toxin CcdB